MSQGLCSPLQCNVCLMLKAIRGKDQSATNLSSNSTNVVSKPCSTCNGCSLIRYCCKAHQRLDWPIHHDFCSAVQRLKAAAQITHPFLLSVIPKSQEDLESTSVQLKFLLREDLNRPLEFHEVELTSYPVHCPQCYTFKDVTTICPDCGNQAYCSEEHLKEHKDEHRKFCGLLELYYCPFKSFPANTDLELILKQRIYNLDKTDLVEAFEKASRIKLPKNPTRNLKDYQLFSYAADFSCICSICFALCHMNISKLEDCSFVIFIIGASIESVLWFRDIHCKFLFLQYPQIEQLHLHFIGPEVAEPPKDVLRFKFLNTERTIYYHSYKGLFQTYCQYFKIKPSIIVAFNCGFSEFSQYYNSAPYISNVNSLEALDTSDSSLDSSTDTWYLGLVEILQTFDTPIIFTSFTKQEADFDFAALQVAALKQRLKVHIDRIFKVPQNPFHDLRPLRQWYVRDQESFYYRNGYIQAIKTKLMT